MKTVLTVIEPDKMIPQIPFVMQTESGNFYLVIKDFGGDIRLVDVKNGFLFVDKYKNIEDLLIKRNMWKIVGSEFIVKAV